MGAEIPEHYFCCIGLVRAVSRPDQVQDEVKMVPVGECVHTFNPTQSALCPQMIYILSQVKFNRPVPMTAVSRPYSIRLRLVPEFHLLNPVQVQVHSGGCEVSGVEDRLSGLRLQYKMRR